MMDEVICSSLVVLFGLFLRCSVTMNSHSGASNPPMFGDFEAQRHWMEITHHLPLKEWYHQTDRNDLEYWGLDYPPLTAYHSKICGYIADLINPEWVALGDSRGHESYGHKLFMRYTVLLVDLFIYIAALLYYIRTVIPYHSKWQQLYASCILISYPGLILIDHGHFQYNCVSLGFALFAIIFLIKDCHELGSVFFVLALNYKQMELYHALPFFFYLLGVSLSRKTWYERISKLATIGISVIITFILCWLPFLTSTDSAAQVLHRLFPFNRGLFEDKVANVWCSISVVIKIKNLLSQQNILRLCLLSTLVACAPSCYNVLRWPTRKKFLYCLVNCSLSFFLFSYQVHEKSILIVALPVMLVMFDSPLVSLWFLCISTVSMYPLLSRDGQSVSYFALLAVFIILTYNFVDIWTYCWLVKYSIIVSFGLGVVLHVAHAFLKPPTNLPFLYPLLFAVFSCAHFVVFWFYYNIVQWDKPGDESPRDRMFHRFRVKDPVKHF